MAVCGRCWICNVKFDCIEKQSCGDCTKHKPLVITRDERPVIPPNSIGGEPYKICGVCEDDIESGAMMNLIDALRDAVAARRKAET